MKRVFIALALCATQAFAQADPQQQIAAQSVVIQYLQQQLDAKASYIAMANAEIEKLRKQIEDAKPKEPAKK